MGTTACVCVCVCVCVCARAQGFRSSEDEWLYVWDERVVVPPKPTKVPPKPTKVPPGTPLRVVWTEGDAKAYAAVVQRSTSKRVFLHYDVRRS